MFRSADIDVLQEGQKKLLMMAELHLDAPVSGSWWSHWLDSVQGQRLMILWSLQVYIFYYRIRVRAGGECASPSSTSVTTYTFFEDPHFRFSFRIYLLLTTQCVIEYKHKTKP